MFVDIFSNIRKFACERLFQILYMINFNVIIYVHRKPTIGKVKKKLLYHVVEVDRCGFPKADIIMIVCSRKKPIAN